MTLEGDGPAVPTKRESLSFFWPTIAVIMTTVTRTLIMPSPIDLKIYRDCVRAMLDRVTEHSFRKKTPTTR